MEHASEIDTLCMEGSDSVDPVVFGKLINRERFRAKYTGANFIAVVRYDADKRMFDCAIYTKAFTDGSTWAIRDRVYADSIESMRAAVEGRYGAEEGTLAQKALHVLDEFQITTRRDFIERALTVLCSLPGFTGARVGYEGPIRIPFTDGSLVELDERFDSKLLTWHAGVEDESTSGDKSAEEEEAELIEYLVVMKGGGYLCDSARQVFDTILEIDKGRRTELSGIYALYSYREPVPVEFKIVGGQLTLTPVH